jgi:predicted permease
MLELSPFQNILFKILPLYLVIVLGYIAGRFLDIERKSISLMIMYVVAPIVFFNGIIKDRIPLSSLNIALVVFLICCILALLALGVGSLLWKNFNKNLLALCASSGNMGYFGLPVGLAIFGEQALGVLIMGMLGIIIFQNSTGFFITANGKHSFNQSLKKTLLVPNLYAVALAFWLKDYIDLNNLNSFAKGIFKITDNFTGAYSILGMLIVGLGLAQIKKIKLDKDTAVFLLISLFFKFILFPLLTYAFIIIDQHTSQIFNNFTYKVLMLLSLTPIPANAIVIASSLKLNTDKISIAVMISNILALFLIPYLMTIWN